MVGSSPAVGYGWYACFFAVFGHGASCEGDASAFHQLDELVVGEGGFLVFRVHYLVEHVSDLATVDVVAFGIGARQLEEVGQGVDAPVEECALGAAHA